MPEFLTLLPPAQALERLRQHLPTVTLSAEEIQTTQALGRVTAEPIRATQPLPAFARSTVDGYAVKAADTFGASDSLPAYLSLIGEVPMGDAPGFILNRGEAALIHTGGMLPSGADAVLMVEHVQSVQAGEIEVLRAVAQGDNVLAVGEDVAPDQVVIPQGVHLRPAEIGGLLALGLLQVRVVRKPVVAILSSGDELVPPDQPTRPGQVRDINTYTLKALVELNGGQAVSYGIVPDSAETLRQAVATALAESDLVVITAGSSASTRDLTAQIIQELGPPGVLVHGVNVRPGKPTILAVCAGKGVIGLPGNPVSALIIAGLFVTPVLESLLGLSPDRPRPTLSARLTTNLPSQAGREDWVPVRLSSTGEGCLADPIFFKSNLIFNLVDADGLVHIPADATGLSAGDWVSVFCLRPS